MRDMTEGVIAREFTLSPGRVNRRTGRGQYRER